MSKTLDMTPEDYDVLYNDLYRLGFYYDYEYSTSAFRVNDRTYDDTYEIWYNVRDSRLCAVVRNHSEIRIIAETKLLMKEKILTAEELHEIDEIIIKED